jgi:CubicO group peptidase (beta-lactamase class C family)
LLAQPGSSWNYSLSTDVLGRVVEVVSGQTLDVFFRDRILMPLGMTDTAFDVSEAKWSRFATLYTPESGGIRPLRDPETFRNTIMSPLASYKTPKKYLSGGAGLTSTARDYWRFAQMLLNGGTLDGTRLLSPKTIELMTMSHTADLPQAGFGPGLGFGLGFAVVMNLAVTENFGSAGMYGWSGLYGTRFWVDPKEQLVSIVMVQRYPGSTVDAGLLPLVYQSLTRPAIARP